MRALTIAGLGDSISYGMGDRGPGWIGPSWVARLAHRVGAARHVNLSTPGQRIGDLARIQMPAATSLRPSHALLSIGGNDLMRPTFDPARLLIAIRATLVDLHFAGAETVVLGLPDPRVHDAAPTWLRRALAERAWEANVALGEAVASAGGPPVAHLLDLWSDPVTRTRDYWHVDRMHPSPRGHDHLAERARELLRLPSTRPPLPVETSCCAKPRGEAVRWLLREGVPWASRRSVDVIPLMAVALAAHSATRPRRIRRLGLAREATRRTPAPAPAIAGNAGPRLTGHPAS